jgi:hypothetical protein
MRFWLMVVAVAALIYIGGYQYLKYMVVDSQGTTVWQSFGLARARRKMVQIADLERERYTTTSERVSMDQLISEKRLDQDDTERDGYSFSIECGDAPDFFVIGKHALAPPGSPLRWPILIVDHDLEFRKPGN